MRPALSTARTEPHRAPARPAGRTKPLLAWLAAAWLAGAGAATASTGAGSPAAKPVPSQPAGTPAQAMARVQALVGEAACRSDADCQTLPVGRRACGGPAQYLPWSAWRTSGKALSEAAAPTLKAAPAEGEGMMGTCQVLMDPGAQCQRPPAAPPSAPGRCVLRQAPALPLVR